MTISRDEIESAIKPLLGQGFSILEFNSYPQSFGNTRVVLRASDLMLRLTTDRVWLHVHVAPSDSPDRAWFSMAQVFKEIGLKNEVTPWVSPKEAVGDFLKHRFDIARSLHDQVLLERLTRLW